jgi:hypothetical protein
MPPLFDGVPEMVPLEQEILGPVGETVLGAKKESSSIVFKDTATHSCGKSQGQIQDLNGLQEKQCCVLRGWSSWCSSSTNIHSQGLIERSQSGASISRREETLQE